MTVYFCRINHHSKRKSTWQKTKRKLLSVALTTLAVSRQNSIYIIADWLENIYTIQS